MNPSDPIYFISTDFIFPNTNQELFNLSFENEEDIKSSFGPTQLNNSFNEYNYSNKYEIPNYNPIGQNKPKPKKPSNNPEDKIALLGRKTKDSGETGEHTKYSEDNMARKIKVLLKNDFLELINNKINL